MSDHMTPLCTMCFQYLDSEGKPAGKPGDGDPIGYITNCVDCMGKLGFSPGKDFSTNPACTSPVVSEQPVYRSGTQLTPEHLEQDIPY